ncbi:hypothetical protein YC2023_105130 [Brassica napus]
MEDHCPMRMRLRLFSVCLFRIEYNIIFVFSDGETTSKPSLRRLPQNDTEDEAKKRIFPYRRGVITTLELYFPNMWLIKSKVLNPLSLVIQSKRYCTSQAIKHKLSNVCAQALICRGK